jgi:hypothetical protein
MEARHDAAAQADTARSLEPPRPGVTALGPTRPAESLPPDDEERLGRFLAASRTPNTTRA